MHRDSMFDDSDVIPDVYSTSPRATNELEDESRRQSQVSRPSTTKRRIRRKRQDITREIGDIDPLLLEKMKDWGKHSVSGSQMDTSMVH
jgi:hypothetical protein